MTHCENIPAVIITHQLVYTAHVYVHRGLHYSDGAARAPKSGGSGSYISNDKNRTRGTRSVGNNRLLVVLVSLTESGHSLIF